MTRISLTHTARKSLENLRSNTNSVMIPTLRTQVLLVALLVIVLTFSLAVALNTIAKSTGNCPEFATNLVVSPETCGLCGTLF